jgi:diguanylate cyclase (GGDEF)-like protein
MLMAGGSAASYAAHPPTVRWTTLALTAPITIHFATVDDTLHRALAFGAVMYVAATFRSISKLGDFFARTHSLSHEVQRQRDRAEALARTDPLTGLNNRRAFYELGELAMRHAARYEHPLSMVMIDIDRFKSINDEFGHGVGDAVIRSLAKLIDKHYRNTDISCRFGGEEFAVLLPETDLDGALLTAERLRNVVEEHVIICEGHKLRFTASFGVAAMCTGQSLDDLLVTADRALYEAKRTGRNSVRPHSEKPAVSSAMGSA